jgi:hypothetical protein
MGGNDMEENCSTRKEFVRKTQKSGQTVNILFSLQNTRGPVFISLGQLQLFFPAYL